MQWLANHSLIPVLAAAAVFTVLWLYRSRSRLEMKPGWAPVLGLLHVVLGVACVKVFAMLEAGSLRTAGAMSLFGAVFFLPLAYWLGARLTKRPIGAFFDVFAVPMVFTLACARVNCLFSGCCLGLPIPGAGLRYPTREAELIFYGVLLIWMFLRTAKGDSGGRLYPVYMIAYGCFRFLVEFFRVSGSGTLFHLSHLWAALCFLTGLSVWLELKRKADQPSNEKTNHRRKSK